MIPERHRGYSQTWPILLVRIFLPFHFLFEIVFQKQSHLAEALFSLLSWWSQILHRPVPKRLRSKCGYYNLVPTAVWSLKPSRLSSGFSKNVAKANISLSSPWVADRNDQSIVPAYWVAPRPISLCQIGSSSQGRQDPKNMGNHQRDFNEWMSRPCD